MWGELEVVKDKKRECRHGKGELGLVSTLFIRLVGSGFREPRGSGHLSPLTSNQHLELRYFLITFACNIGNPSADSQPSVSDPIVYAPQ